MCVHIEYLSAYVSLYSVIFLIANGRPLLTVPPFMEHQVRGKQTIESCYCSEVYCMVLFVVVSSGAAVRQ